MTNTTFPRPAQMAGAAIRQAEIVERYGRPLYLYLEIMDDGH